MKTFFRILCVSLFVLSLPAAVLGADAAKVPPVPGAGGLKTGKNAPAAPSKSANKKAPSAPSSELKPGKNEVSDTVMPLDSLLPYREQVFTRFLEFYQKGISEKLYLMTDKPYYSAGEKIWFKGFLVNAVTLAPQSNSNYIYVELVNNLDSLIQRSKIKADEWGFHNCIALKPDVPWGDYTLRAYTSWMKNDGPDYFFRRNIRIVNPIDDAVTTQVSYTRGADSSVVMTVRLVDNALIPITEQRLSYKVDFGGKVRNFNHKTDDKGTFQISFKAPADSVRGTVRLIIDEPSRQFDQKIILPVFDHDFDVQFFPEGGHLLSAFAQKIAFKAIGSNGLGVDVTGKLFDQDGTQVTDFISAHRGMGSFSILAMPGQRFYAEVTSDGITRRFDLPEIASSGCSIKVAQLRGRLLYQVFLTPDIDPAGLAAIVQSRGKILAADELTPEGLSKAIGMENLPEGICQVIVVEKTSGRPLAERLTFVARGDHARAAVTSERNDYGKREQVDLALKVTDSYGKPAEGIFALTVTDRNTVRQDSMAGNILSSLLLSSDLKGYIEDPGYYFIDASPRRAEDLDLLMMSQGWTRFSMKDVLLGKVAPKRYPVEQTQTISGSITGFFGQEAKKPSILIFDPRTKFMDIFQLDGGNRFIMTDLDFADSTTFVIQAMNKGGGTRSVTLKIEPEMFPPLKTFIPRAYAGSRDNALPDAFLNQSRERYYYEGGMRVIDMREIVVTTQRPERNNLLYNATPSRSISGAMLENFVGMDIFGVLQTIAGIQVTGEDIRIRGSNDSPLVYIDNMQVDVADLATVMLSDVQSIDIVMGPEANIFGLGSSGGVILVYLKTGADRTFNVLPSLAKVSHLGYKKPEKFYQPKYEVPGVLRGTTPDLRTTLCWEPCIKTDSTGVARVTFFTADRPSTYDIILEGVTSEGELCRTVTSVERKK